MRSQWQLKVIFFRKSTDPLRWYSVDWLSVNIHGVSPWFDSPCGLPDTVSGPPPDTWRLGEADKWWDVSRITQAFAGLLCCGTSVGGLSSSVSRRHLPVVFLDQKLCGYVPTRLCQSILRIRYGSLKLKLIFLLPPPSSLALHGLCPPLLIWWTRETSVSHTWLLWHVSKRTHKVEIRNRACACACGMRRC